MRLEHNFTVAAPVDRAWEVLLDLERIVPCMPGAALTSYDGDEFTGTVRVKLGPVVMSFAGKGRFVERDAAAHRMVIEAAGRDTKGAGSAAAKINAMLSPDGDVTAVAVVTDLTITGRVAQLGRGMIPDVSARLLTEFTRCLAGQLAPSAAAAATESPSGQAVAPTPPAPAAPTPTPTAPTLAAATPSTAVTAVSDSPPAVTPEPAGAEPRPSIPAPRATADPIDLLGVTGVRTSVRQVVPYVATFLLGAAVAAVVMSRRG